jgi:hypothetical protein
MTSKIERAGEKTGWVSGKASGCALILLLGTAAYFLHVVLQVIFIPVLSLDADFCLDHIEFEVAEDEWDSMCISFKSPLEEAKYYHNVQMKKRNKGLLLLNS